MTKSLSDDRADTVLTTEPNVAQQVPVQATPNAGRLLQWTFLALFTIYAFLHVIYMTGYAPKGLYYGAFALLLVAAGARIAWLLVTRWHSLGDIHFLRSFSVLIGAAAVLVVISWIREYPALETLTWTGVGQAFYIVAPALIALCVVNTATARQLDLYAIILLARYSTYFVLAFSTDFSLASVTEISWSASSSPFESSFAHDLLIVEAYFVFRNRKLLALAAGALTMLSLKRASFVLAPAMIIASRWLRSMKPASRRYLLGLAAIGIASPYLVMYVYSQGFVELAAERFGFDINTVTTGRLEIYQIATGLLSQTTGFGSLNPLLTALVDNHFGTYWNSQLHNDTLRLHMEVGFIGVAVYVCALVYLGRSSRVASLLITYTMFVLITSRLITHTSYWVALFLVIALIERWIHEHRAPARLEEGSGVASEVAER